MATEKLTLLFSDLQPARGGMRPAAPQANSERSSGDRMEIFRFQLTTTVTARPISRSFGLQRAVGIFAEARMARSSQRRSALMVTGLSRAITMATVSRTS